KSKQAFRAVDFDAPLALAKIAKNNGARQYLLVSALGANKNSSIFYNRVKGEIEEEIGKIGFESFHIVRPSLLLGDRPDQRAGEEAAQFFYKVFGKLIPTKYKAIDSAKVARALLSLASSDQRGHWVHESGSLQTY
ncbi:MAG: oxidoreductase, partial [Cytophagales bacterium]